MKKKGISLIMLIIAVIIMIIIAGTALFIIKENNPIVFAREAAFKEEIRSMQQIIETDLAEKVLESEGEEVLKTGDLAEFLDDAYLIKKYDQFFTIIDSKCIVSSEAVASTKYEKQVEWAVEIGFKTMKDVSGTAMKDGFDGVVNRPDVVKGLIPVAFNEVDRKWHVVEPENTAKPYWYDYENQQWANAVTLFDENMRDKILASDGRSIKKEAVDTILEMEQISAMWVWIPRYSYKITPKTGTQIAGKIDIEFAKDLVKTTKDGYIMHPAFTFDEEEVYGIWAAKFQAGTEELTAIGTGVNQGSTAYESNNANLLRRNLLFKPDMFGVSDVKLSTAFEKCRKLEMDTDLYGWHKEEEYDKSTGKYKTDNNSMDIHMMKSTEYGAIAYLATSKYGKIGNTNFGDDEKMMFANTSTTTYSPNYLTGRSVGVPNVEITNTLISQHKSYDVDILGTGASSTGSIYGVYDLAGRRRNATMGCVDSRFEMTGFTELPDDCYYDLFKSTWAPTKVEPFPGTATDETMGWFGNRYDIEESPVTTNTYKWMLYGMVYDYSSYETAGLYTVDLHSGHDEMHTGYYFDKWGFRPIIVPKPLV